MSSTRFFQVRSRLSLLAGLAAVCIAGCGSGTPSSEHVVAWLKQQNRESDGVSTVESIEVAGAEKQSDGTLKLEFIVTEKLQSDVFQPVTLAEAFEKYNHNARSFEAAQQTLPTLREPEHSAAAAILPTIPIPAKLFHLTAAGGESVSWKGSAVASKREDAWEFSNLQGQINAQIINDETVSRSELPIGATLLEPTVQDNAITQLIAQQKAFTTAVSQAEAAIQKRLDREHEQLLRMIRSNQTFVVSIPAQNGPDQKVHIRVAHHDNEGELVFALLEDASNVFKRATWHGALRLADPPQAKGASIRFAQGSRPDPDGWSVTLSPVPGENVFPRAGSRGEIVLAMTTDNQLVWLHHNKPLPLEVVADSTPLPEYAAYVEQVQQWTRPGQVWEGTIQYTGDVSHKVRMTFTEVRDGGNYVRATMETPIDDYAVAVLEGTVTTTPAGIYSWPVKLKWSSGTGTKFKLTQHEIPLITAGGDLSVAFSADGQSFGSASQYATFELKPVQTIASFQESSSRWRNGLQPGVRWSGQIIRGDQPAEKISVTVCQAHADGRSCQVAVQNPDDPHQYRVFAATLQAEDAVADGYALVLSATSDVTRGTYFGYSGYDDIYGIQRTAKHWFRLTADGKTLWGISGAKELLRLTREETVVDRPLDYESAAQRWRQACESGNRWRGRLTNTTMNESTPVEVAVSKSLDPDGNVEVTVSIPRQRKSDMRFRGRLSLDEDNVNAFALVLQKQEGQRGQGDSLVFGQSTSGIFLSFRMTDDGNGLIGMAQQQIGAKELLELEKVK